MPIRQRGFTLIEIVVVLVVVAVLIAMASALTRGMIAGQKRSLTATRIQAVEAALLQFVMQQRRLPCPADGTKPSQDVDAGIEMPRTAAAGCDPVSQTGGVVPWRALGLSETDATDGWDRRFTYRIFPALAADNGMNMSWCDPAGTAGASGTPPATTCRNDLAPNNCSTAAPGNCTMPSAFLANKGLEVRRFDGTTIVMNPAGTPHTGAAYVLISHGEGGGGGYLGSGNLADNAIDSGPEQVNYASKPYTTTYYYIDEPIDERPASHFDDIVIRPSLLALINKAGLGPRPH